MEKAMKAVYITLTAIVFGIGALLFFTFKNDVVNTRNNLFYTIQQDYTKEEHLSEDAPQGVIQEYTFRITQSIRGEKSLIFYVIHQNAQVYLDDELVYSLAPSKTNLFGHSPGCQWCSIPLEQEDIGKLVRIIITPIYPSYVDFSPEFVISSKYDLARKLIGEEWSILFLSLLAVLIGFIIICYTAYIRRFRITGSNLWLLGFFAIGIGLWKMADTPSMALIFPDSLLISNMTFLGLLLVSFPFVMFLKEMIEENTHPIWYVMGMAFLLVTTFTIIAQITNVMDFRQSLSINLTVMCLGIIICAIMVIYEAARYGIQPELKLTLICLLCCLVAFFIDMGLFFYDPEKGRTVVGMIGCVTSICVLGGRSFLDARRLFRLGAKAKELEKIAYRDTLSGLYNRSAYDEEIRAIADEPAGHAIIIFDLNDLKHCNDTYGHEVGDVLIQSASFIIEQTFKNIGKIYRIGGDEFSVIVPDADFEKLEFLISRFIENMNVYNNAHPDSPPVHIAHGFAIFSEEDDTFINDTARRADKNMYLRKIQMKKDGYTTVLADYAITP